MDLLVSADGRLRFGSETVPCALGRSGVVAGRDKREGDGATPAGRWPLRRVLYRPDRLPAPETALPVQALTPTDGWCDAPGDPNYNRPVILPYPASCEDLWREDHVYDIIVILGHNDDPVIESLGSAIFFHLARDHYTPTEGCVAVARPDMLRILTICNPLSTMKIEPSRPL